MNATTAGALGAMAGAALTAVVLLSVGSGPGAVRSPEGRRAAEEPQEASSVDPAPPRGEVEAPRREPSDRPMTEEQPGSPGTRANTERPNAEPSSPALAACREEVAAVTARADRAEGRLRALEGQMRGLKKEADATRTYDLSEEQLVAMADRCELRWDMPPLTLDEPQTVTRSAFEELGMTSDELERANAVMAATNQRLLDAVMGLYVEVTGDTAPAGLAPDAMLAEIVDKTPRDVIRRVYQRLSAERAGLADPPADPSAGDPVERLFRLVTGAGDRLEQDLAEQIGPELARSLRDEHRGWGSKSRSRVGCPGED